MVTKEQHRRVVRNLKVLINELGLPESVLKTSKRNGSYECLVNIQKHHLDSLSISREVLNFRIGACVESVMGVPNDITAH